MLCLALWNFWHSEYVLYLTCINVKRIVIALMELPWIRWFPGDYINKTRHLTVQQHGIYCLLLWQYYTNGPISSNARGLLNVCQAHATAEQEDLKLVLADFFVLRDGKYCHERADAEIAERLSKRELRRLAGKKGGLAKASNARILLEQKATQSQSHIKPITPPTPLSKKGGFKESKTQFPHPCKIHPGSNRTPKGSCWDCYAAAVEAAEYDQTRK